MVKLTEEDYERVRQSFIDAAWEWYYANIQNKTSRKGSDTEEQSFDPGSPESILKDDDII